MNSLAKILSIPLLCLVLATNIGCKNDHLKTIGAIIVVGIAAKIIYDMSIEHETQQITNEKEVINKYKQIHNTLPPEPTLVTYHTSIEPGEVVKVGNDISVNSTLEVVRGTNSQLVDIQEKIIIYDNEDHNKEIKSFTKPVNQETQRSGAFANQFKFTLPEGMPQGVYPIKTQVIIDGKASAPFENQMQLVHHDSFFKTNSGAVDSLIVAL